MSQANPKDSSRVRGDARARRIQRQEEAAARQAAHDALKPQDKLAKLNKRAPRGAQKERHKLNEVLAEAFECQIDESAGLREEVRAT